MIKKLFLSILLTAIVSIAVILVGNEFIDRFNNPPPVAYAFQTENGGACNVAVVPLMADFSTYGASTNVDDVLASIEAAKEDSAIKGLILQVDSPGGTPVSGEMIANALKRLGKPTVALIREQGDSAAYWASTGASQIIASPDSDVGSIGVTESYVDTSQQDTSQGKQFVQLSIGQFKDLGNPDKPLTSAEKALIERDLKIVYNNFVAAVATNRHLSTTTVEALADGSSMTGQMALQNHLVDQLGDAETARAWLGQQIKSKAVLCAAQ